MADLLSTLVKTAVRESIKNQSLAATALVSQSEVRAQLVKRIAKQTATSGARRTQELASGQQRDFDPGQRIKQELSSLANKGLYVAAPEMAKTLRNVRNFKTVVNATKALIHADNPLTVAMSLKTLISSHKAIFSEEARFEAARESASRDLDPRSLYYYSQGRAIRFNERDEMLWRASQVNGGVVHSGVIEGLCARMSDGDKVKFMQSMTVHLRQLCHAKMLSETLPNSGVYNVTTLFFEKHLVYECRKAEPGNLPAGSGRAHLNARKAADEITLYNTDRKIMNSINKCAQSSALKFDPAEERRRIESTGPATEVEQKLRAFDRSLDKLQKAGLIYVNEDFFALTDRGRSKLAELNELNRLRDLKDFKVGTWDHKNILGLVAVVPKSLADWETEIRRRYSGSEADRQWLMVFRRIEKHAAAGNVIIENDQVRLSDQGRALTNPPDKPFDFSKYDAQQIMPRLQEPISRDALREVFVEKYPNQATLERQWTIFEKRLDKNIAAGMVSLDEHGFLSISERGQEALESFKSFPKQTTADVSETSTFTVSKQDARIMQYTRDGVFSGEVYRQLRRQEEPEIENDLIEHELLVINRRLLQLQKASLAERTGPDTVQCSDFLADRSRVALERSRKPKEIALSHEQDELIRSLGVFANVTREQALQHIYGGRVPLFEMDLADLKRRSLIDTVIVHVKNYGEQQVLGLSKLGRQVAGYRIGDDQILTESKVNTRPAEMAHDLLIFDAYQDAKGRLEAAGKDVTIVYSDRQSKSIDMREQGRQDEAYADLKIVYKDRQTGEIGTLNLEVAVNYKDHEISKKSSIANCLWYTPGAAQASRIRRVLPGAQVIQFA